MDKNLSVLFYAIIMLATGGFLFLAEYLQNKGKQKTAILSTLLAFLPLFLMFGLRYDVGTDYFHTYVPHFTTIANGGKIYEGGFYLINKVISLFTRNAQWLFIITGFLYAYFTVDSIRRYSPNPIISVIVLFLMSFVFVAMNNVRQQLAVVMILWGFRFILDEKMGEYILTCLTAAFFFHTSALFMIPIYFLVNIKFIRDHAILIAICTVLIVPFASNLLIILLKALGYGYFLESYIRESGGNFFFLMQNLVFFGLLCLAFEKTFRKDRLRFGLLTLQFLGVIMGLISYTTHLIELPERIAYYFMIFEIISIPLALKDLKKYDKRVSTLCALAVLVLILHNFISGIYLNGYHEVIPYQFIFGHWHELEVPIQLLI